MTRVNVNVDSAYDYVCEESGREQKRVRGRNEPELSTKGFYNREDTIDIFI